MRPPTGTPAVVLAAIFTLLVLVCPASGTDESGATLPEGVRATWDMAKAYRVTTSTREKICINGLWRWQPSTASAEQAPKTNWGYFKVPGAWPGITDYMQKDSQTVHAHPNWKNEKLADVSAAWYERTVSVPQEWAGRRIALTVEYLNSYAVVLVDGKRRGEIRFPGGELDLTGVVQTGQTHVLSLLVVAMPLKAALLSYSDSNAAREMKGKVARRGLCGDVFLVSTPSGPHIREAKIDTSVRKGRITVDVALEGLTAGRSYWLQARILKEGKVVREFASEPLQLKDIPQGRLKFSSEWTPDALWDVHTPTNQLEARLFLAESEGRQLDAQFPLRFGFREFWIQGKDFFLNGTRLFLCAVPLDNAQVGAAWSTYQGARESLERLKGIGINFVYTHNYDCEPGAHLSFADILRAADDVGMLVSLSQPHFSHYDWRAPDADQTNGYAAHARFYVEVAGNHPAVVAYAMSHNATGYEEDMNPDKIDGLPPPRDRWSDRNAKVAVRAEALVQQMDPGRIVYHHASGNLGPMHTVNFYPNFVPIQELSDWFGPWSQKGTKPVFLCEYGAPFTWDWTMYRGWYKGEREFGSAKVPWEFCLAEWNSQFLGDAAFNITAAEAANLRWEAKQFRAGNVWHRWDYPNPVGSSAFEERYAVFARYLHDNWRAFRTWGVSGISPWEHEHFWKLREGVDRRRREFKTDWDQLQRPGFSPDYLDRTYERWDLAFERTDWIPTAAARALMRNNGPLLAYIAGRPGQFTSKDHVFFAGETLEKQLIIINNSRETVTGEVQWSLGLPSAVTGRTRFSLKTGEQERIPLRFALPATLAAGEYELSAITRFRNGGQTTDALAIQVLPRVRPPQMSGRVALFDPTGKTGAVLDRMGVGHERIQATTEVSGFDVLIVGHGALTVDGAAPDIRRVREGLKVLIFEQRSDVLERRFGFRVTEYGLREVFARVPDHPALAGADAVHLRDWRGEATILPSRLDYTLRPRYGPTIHWCDIPVPRLWRCGNRGNVASVLIEKPTRGDFLPILDGGFSLQYTPLMEYREGRGMILFCQLDVTGRTELDPAAETLSRNILEFVAQWRPSTARTARYLGDPAGRRHLESAGFDFPDGDIAKLSSNEVVVVGPGGGRELSSHGAALAAWRNSGGTLLALGLNAQEAEALGITNLTWTKAEHISASFEPPEGTSPFRGVGPADLHNRDPRELWLVRARNTGAGAPRGAGDSRATVTVFGDGVLAASTKPNVVFCQMVPWEFGPTTQSNLKRTQRRASFGVTRLLSNLGVSSSTPILEHFNRPVTAARTEKRWLEGLYLDSPEEWDVPYRFFRW